MSPPGTSTPDLTVRGESIERVYGSYAEGRYLVNRRYQRKLIWTLEEKVNFIDSILNGYPVPIILLAENKKRDVNLIEIIDGMQRLNAVTAFIENEYMVHDAYFDLNTMAVTKALLDSKKLAQKMPMMSREQCVRVASYLLPLSIYEFSDTANVDEVFRRINSGGRKLSRQELRTAGATGHFAQVVRKIAAKVRGDDSSSDILRLNEMKRISITNRDLAYGIGVDSVFWVAQGILTKEQVRESRDEELIADIVAYMVSETPQSSRTEFLDAFFGLSDDEASVSRFNDIETAVQRRGADLVIRDFQRTLDDLTLTLAQSEKTFGELLFSAQPARAPRYFQAVFLALYELIVRRNMEVKNRNSLVLKMQNSGASINVPEGGRWGAEQRQQAIHAVVGVYEPVFAAATTIDPAVIHWITQLQNLLAQSYTEQSAYDFKQGFLRLDGSNIFDEDSFEKILQTCVGIANIRKGTKGYVVVGVADKANTAQRIEQLYAVQPKSYESFFVVGVEHEARALSKTLDQLFQLIIEKVKNSKMSPELREHLARHLKLVRYYDKSVFVFDVEAQDDPSNYAGQYFVRHGAQLDEVPTTELPAFIRRYNRGS